MEMKTGSRRGNGGSGNSGDTLLFVAPRVLACAWCAQQGRLVVAVRPLDDRRWCDSSPAFALVLKAAGFASHGVCPACRPAVAAEWGVALSTYVAS